MIEIKLLCNYQSVLYVDSRGLWLRILPFSSVEEVAHTAAPCPRASCFSVCKWTRFQLPKSTSFSSNAKHDWQVRLSWDWCRTPTWRSQDCQCLWLWYWGVRFGSGKRIVSSFESCNNWTLIIFILSEWVWWLENFSLIKKKRWEMNKGE